MQNDGREERDREAEGQERNTGEARALARIGVWEAEGYPEDPKQLTPDVCRFMSPEQLEKALAKMPTATATPGAIPAIGWTCEQCGHENMTMGQIAVAIAQGQQGASHCEACGSLTKIRKSAIITGENIGPNRQMRRAMR